MSFSSFSKKFRMAAKQKEMSDRQTEDMLAYAKKLFRQGLPIIFDQKHLALLIGYDYSFLLSASNKSTSFYKHYEVPKRSGGTRSIDEPLPSLKEIQHWILSEILVPASKVMVSPVAKAFMPGKSLRDNARFHRRRKKVVALDIQDFFPSIGFGAVYGIFQRMGYTNPVCVMLSRLCTLRGKLPQGAPTSPMLSNIFLEDLDKKLFQYCRNRNIQYTRYADDLIFSGNDLKQQHLIPYVQMLLSSNKLKLNESKTKIMGRGMQQHVTGVVVNEKLQVSRDYRDKIRQEIYYCIKFGETSHWEHIKDDLPKWILSPQMYLKHLLGKVNYVLQINPKDKVFLDYRDYLKGRIAHIS